ncbi:FKBP-type peptidyl-prolyl cis-trans isomerase [Asticcacaulis solisilvae]
MAKREAQDEAAAAANIKAGQAFLTKVAKEPGVVTLPSGLMYKVVSAPDPNGAKPSPNATVKINYEGKLIDGTVFDSSYDRGTPASFPLARLVKAWQVALPMMHKGDTWMLYVPAELGYGQADMGAIPPNSTLVFKIQLLDFQG